MLSTSSTYKIIQSEELFKQYFQQVITLLVVLEGEVVFFVCLFEVIAGCTSES